MANIKNLVLSLTGNCNFACKYCYASEHDKSVMSKEVALAAVDMAAASGEKFVIQFSGGEPLLNFPVLQSVVKYVEDKKFPAIMQIQTNASLMTEEIARYLFKHKVGIGVSLDGRPEINDKLRFLANGKGATKAIVAGIDTLRTEGIGIGITCVVTSQNVNVLEGIVDFAYYLGNVHVLGFDILRGQGRGKNLLAPTENEMFEAMQRVYDRADMYAQISGFKLQITQEKRVCNLMNGHAKAFGHCYAMNGEAAFVDASGKIFACSSLVDNEDFYIGNVQTGLDQDLQNKVATMIKETMCECSACKDLQVCGGGCFARVYGNNALSKAECAMQRECIKRVKLQSEIQKGIL